MKMTDLKAIDIVERDENATEEQELRAWAYLIKTGLVWCFQGFYQRTASHLIECGIISRNGRISWKTIEALKS